MMFLHINSVDELMVQPGETSSPVDSSLEDDSRSSVASQTSEPAIQDTHTLLRLLPKSEIDTPLQDLPSSPIEPLDDTERYIPADPENISLPRHNGTCSPSTIAA